MHAAGVNRSIVVGYVLIRSRLWNPPSGAVRRSSLGRFPDFAYLCTVRNLEIASSSSNLEVQQGSGEKGGPFLSLGANLNVDSVLMSVISREQRCLRSMVQNLF